MPTKPVDVISFWMQDCDASPESLKKGSRRWYKTSDLLDAEIETRFGPVLASAERGELSGWEDSAHGILALVILFDQFSRNLYRRTADAFRNDPRALQLAEHAVSSGLDHNLSLCERLVLYHPFHHAESRYAQQQAVALYTQLENNAGQEWAPVLASFTRSAVGHQDIIARFGRFPHRNAVLKRTGTATEAAWLKEHNRRFGQ